MMQRAKLCVVLLAFGLGWHGLPDRGFAQDYTQSTNFGVLNPGDHVNFKVTPPKNGKGQDAIVTSGRVDDPGGFTWIGSLANWSGTVPPDFAAQHIGLFSGEYGYPGTNGGQALTWKMDTAAEVVKLETITDATIPSDRTRRKLGVGERVTLTLKGADNSVAWSLIGPGSIDPTSGYSIRFTAYERASGASVTATYKGKTFPANFTVIEPSGAIIEQEPGTGVWHIQGEPSVGFIGRAYELPADVSFYNIETQEGSVNAVATGYFAYQNGLNHEQGPWVTVGDVVPGKGSRENFVDQIQGVSNNHTPYEAGTFTWAIPWSFRVGSGTPKVFAIINQIKTIDATGKLTISKGGTTKSAELNDPTSNY